jgi:hypothetical protein
MLFSVISPNPRTRGPMRYWGSDWRRSRSPSTVHVMSPALGAISIRNVWLPGDERTLSSKMAQYLNGSRSGTLAPGKGRRAKTAAQMSSRQKTSIAVTGGEVETQQGRERVVEVAGPAPGPFGPELYGDRE